MPDTSLEPNYARQDQVANRWGHENPYRDANNAPRLIRTPYDLIEELGIKGEPEPVQRERLREFFASPHEDVPDVVRLMLIASGLLVE